MERIGDKNDSTERSSDIGNSTEKSSDKDDGAERSSNKDYSVERSGNVDDVMQRSGGKDNTLLYRATELQINIMLFHSSLSQVSVYLPSPLTEGKGQQIGWQTFLCKSLSCLC